MIELIINYNQMIHVLWVTLFRPHLSRARQFNTIHNVPRGIS